MDREQLSQLSQDALINYALKAGNLMQELRLVSGRLTQVESELRVNQ